MWRREKKLKRRGPLLLFSSSDFGLNGFFFFQVRNHAACTNDAAIVTLYTQLCSLVRSFFLFYFWFSADRSTRAHAGERDGQREAQIGLDHLTVVVCVYGHSPFCPLLELVQLLSDYILLFCQCCSAQLAECLRPFAGIKRRLISLLDDGFLSFFEPPVFILSTPPSFLLYICFQLKILTALYMTGWSLWSVFTLWLASQFDALQWIWMDFRPGQNLKINDPGFFQVINKFTLHSMMGVINPLEKSCASKIWIDY
jgi:hypothetical protein